MPGIEAPVLLVPGIGLHQERAAIEGWAYGDDRRGVPFARLRTVGGQHVFTLKRPAENVLSCEERETAIADREQMHRAVVAMGFRPTVRIVKTRRTKLRCPGTRLLTSA